MNAENGKVVWKVENSNLAISETMSAMPMVIKDKVIVGVMGGERGVRGHVSAYNVDTGNLRWRYYSMGPNNEVGIGPKSSRSTLTTSQLALTPGSAIPGAAAGALAGLPSIDAEHVPITAPVTAVPESGLRREWGR
jgi:hypothetical protein